MASKVGKDMAKLAAKNDLIAYCTVYLLNSHGMAELKSVAGIYGHDLPGKNKEQSEAAYTELQNQIATIFEKWLAEQQIVGPPINPQMN